MSNNKAILLAVPMAFEDTIKLVNDLEAVARSNDLAAPYTVVDRPIKLKAIPYNAILVADLPFRIAHDLPGLLLWLKTASDRGTTVICPGSWDLRANNPCLSSQIVLLEALSAFPAQMKVVRIREGLHYAKLRGRTIGRQSTAPDLEARALAVFEQCRSIRGTERKLKEAGFCLSRSAIHRLVKKQGGGSNE